MAEKNLTSDVAVDPWPAGGPAGDQMASAALLKGSKPLAQDLSGSPPIVPESLVYTTDRGPGIHRRRAGKGFSYRDANGQPLSADERARVVKLGVPPAYTDVWICPVPNGHLQATGIDAKGRKQYLYHPQWGAWRSNNKFEGLVEFGKALPALRRRVQRDLQSEVGDQTFTLAALILLLDRTWLRIGNKAYTAQNRTFGATTLRSRHLSLSDGTVRLRFVAKGGKTFQQTLRDRRLHRVMQEISDLPGRNIFTYLDETSKVRTVASHHVNNYLAEATGLAGMSAKTFRTWGGSLAAFEVAMSATDRLTVKMMAETAAERLANTPAICRSSYIHPAILDLAALEPDQRRALIEALQRTETIGLKSTERQMLTFLQTANSVRHA